MKFLLHILMGANFQLYQKCQQISVFKKDFVTVVGLYLFTIPLHFRMSIGPPPLNHHLKL